MKRTKHLVKRSISLLLFISLLCGAGVSVAAEPQNVNFYMNMQDYTNPEQANRKTPISAAAVGDTLYLMTYTTLEKWQPGDDQPSVLAEYELETDPYAEVDEAAQAEAFRPDYDTRLLSDGQNVYALMNTSGYLWKLLDEGGTYAPTLIHKLDWGGVRDPEDGNSYSYVSAAVVMDGKMYVAATDYSKSYSNPDLHQWDLETGTLGKVQENCPAVTLTPYKDGLLLCVLRDNDNSWNPDTREQVPAKLATLNPETGETVELLELGTSNYTGLSYNAESNTAYYLATSTVMSLPNLQLPAKVSAYMNTQSWGDGAYGLLDGGMYYKADYQSCEIRGLDMPGVENGALNIYGSYANRAHAEFGVQYPQIATTFNDKYFDSIDGFTNAMVSGEGTVDVLQVDVSYSPFTRLVEKGYALDLSGNADIVAAADAMYPALTEICKVDGKLYALPVRADGNVFTYSKQVWEEELGLAEADLPTTFWELLDFIENWEYDYAEDYPEIKLFENTSNQYMLLSRLMETYIAYCKKQGEAIDFETELFTKLMTKFDGIDFESIEPKVGDSDDDWNEFYNRKSVFLEYGSSMYLSQREDSVYLPLPLDERLETVLPVNVTVMFINPRTTRMEQAELYLTINAKYYDEDNTYITLFPDHNEPVRNASFEENKKSMTESLESAKKALETADPDKQALLKEDIKHLEESLADYDQYTYLVTAEQIAAYRESIAPYLYVTGQTPMNTWDNEGNNELYTQMNQYMEGAIPVDRFIKEISKRVHMMELEDQ